MNCALHFNTNLFWGGAFRIANDIDGDFGLQFLRHLDGYGESTGGTNGVREINQAAINNDAFGVAQASGNILAGN